MSPGAPQNAVREPGTRFFGREEEAARLAGLVEGAPLVSLVGPPGVGKTRLAQHYAVGVAGAVWCDLSEARSAADVWDALAHALGPEATDEGTEPWVLRRLATHPPALLVLDNVEQVADAAPETVGRWLAAAPGLRVLATSRERLRLPGEEVLELEPLPVAAAASLFADRAALARPGWTPEPGEEATVDAIVAELDGLPLAIELAAARIGVLGPAQIHGRLRERFALLAGGPRGGAPRHATLAAAIGWSWHLLPPCEQSALAQCAVFAGGFSVEAAEAVLDLSAHDAVPPLLDVLTDLRDRSLLVTRHAEGLPGEVRLGMYSSLRAFALSALERAGGREVAELRLTDWLLDAAGAWAADARRTGRDVPFARLALESGSLVAMHQAALRRGDPERALGLALLLEPLLARRGPSSLRLRLLDEALGAPGPAPSPALRAQALVARANARVGAGSQGSTLASLDEAESLARAAGRPDLVGEAALQRATTLAQLQRLPEAEVAIGVALELLDGPRAVARALNVRGVIRAWAGRPLEADRDFTEAMHRFTEVGDLWGEAMAGGNVAAGRARVGAPLEALGLLARTLPLSEKAGDPRGHGYQLLSRGMALLELGRQDDARASLEAAVTRLSETPDAHLLGSAWLHLGLLALEVSDPEAADAALTTALGRFDHAGQRWYQAVTHAALGGLALLRSQRLEALHRFAQARALVGPDAPPWLPAVVDLRAALAAAAEGDATALDAPFGAARRLASTHEQVRLALRWAERTLERLALRPLRLPADARWCELPSGERLDLARHRSLRLLLAALAERRHEAPHEALSLHDLLAAGWPGERATPTSAVNRVHVAIWRLRNLGLRELVLRVDDGYLLDPRVPFERLPPERRSS